MLLGTREGSRSIIVFVAGLAGVLAQAACGGTPVPAADAGVDALAPPDISRTETEAQLAPKRAACTFEAGAWPAETIGTDYRVGDDIPIKHVLVIMQENRSFDNYLGRLVADGYYQGGDFTAAGDGLSHDDQVDVPPAGWSNPDGAGGTVEPHPDDAYCYGVNHGWNDMHEQWDGGKNDGFVTENNPNGQRSFYYEDDTVIPFYYALADTFAIGDRYFSSVLSSTWPNRFFLMAATSFGIGDNSFDTLDTTDNPSAQIFDELDRAGRTWKDYTDGPAPGAVLPPLRLPQEHARPQLRRQVRPDERHPERHPPRRRPHHGQRDRGDLRRGPVGACPGIGGQLVENIIRALWASPAWKDTVVFITYDENGGLADHVPPAPACEPDGLAPHDEQGNPLRRQVRHHRVPGPVHRGVALRPPPLRLAPGPRPRVDHAVHRDPVRPARADRT